MTERHNLTRIKSQNNKSSGFFMSSSNKINGNFKGKDIISINQFSLKDLNKVMQTAKRMEELVKKKGGDERLKHKVMAALFYEPSSRTFGSFVAGMQRLGGGIIPIHDMKSSSAGKGESLEDTAKVFASFADVLVVRHPEVGSVGRMADVVDIPVINAGDGIGEHPTQALYDFYTIENEIGRKNLNVTFFGELAHYRPVNSLAMLLTLVPNAEINFVSPKIVGLNPKTRQYLKEKGVKIKETENLDDVIENTDVLYVTRVKKEFVPEDIYKEVAGKYIVNKKTLSKMKKKSVVLHALPRIDEIAVEVDSDPRAAYLRSQVRNGMYVRMALLALVLGKIK